MAGTFVMGEIKVRPGAYFNIQKAASSAVAGVVNGVTAVIFRSNFGPLNKAVELSAEDGYESTFGTAGTTDALKEAFAGGAKTVIACRAGNGGTQASVTLKGTRLSGTVDAIKITALYPGSKALSVSIRASLENEIMKECTIYDGTRKLETFSFVKADNDVVGLDYALKSSKYVKSDVLDKLCSMSDVQQQTFTAGTDPNVTTEDYSNAFAQVEPYEFNTICVDTEDPQVHVLLQSFMERAYNAGSLVQGVVAEKHTVSLEERMSHAAAFNDLKMCYVLNAYVSEQGTDIDGYQTAARIAGMIGAAPSTTSLTHTVINGFTEIKDKLTNTEITNAEKRGCLVLSYNSANQVWIDYAINTFVTVDEDHNEDWKKIRRVKTRFEWIRRVLTTLDNLAGKVDNDEDGRKAMISQIQSIGDAMREEGKIVSCAITLNSAYDPKGDDAWFYVDMVDKDSIEHVYSTFRFPSAL